MNTPVTTEQNGSAHALPPVITSAHLLAVLGGTISRTKLYDLSLHNPLWRGCVLDSTRRRTLWSVQALRDRGILPKPVTAAPAPVAGPGFSYAIQPLEVRHA